MHSFFQAIPSDTRSKGQGPGGGGHTAVILTGFIRESRRAQQTVAGNPGILSGLSLDWPS
jgi:hypothetical protein